MQFFLSACESCTLGFVLLDCNGTKCTGDGLSIPAVAFSQQLLRRNKLPTGCYFFASILLVFHILVITMHVNCPHVRGPLHHILVITVHVNCHMWATHKGSPPPYSSNYCACEPHVRTPLHHIVVITVRVNCHTWATHEGSPPPYSTNYHAC